MAEYTDPMGNTNGVNYPEPPSAGKAMAKENKPSPTPFTSRGAAGFEAGKYSIANTSYPSDLYDSTEKYGGNYVIFYINVSDDSRLLLDQTNLVINGEIPVSLRGGIASLGLNGTQATFAGATVGAGLGLVASGVTGFKSSVDAEGKKGMSQGTKNVLGAAGIGAAAAATVSLAAGGKMARQQKRLTQAIAMYIPNQLNIRYSTEYQTEDTFAFQAAAMPTREVGKAVSNTANMKSMASDIGAIATNVALSKTPEIAGALSAASGLAANPKKEQIFKGVNFREFTFEYKFSPRDSKEAKNVLDIIYLFKLHMHPEYKDKNGFLFIYPSEFDIFYYQNHKENLNLHRHTSCVLKDMNVNYTPNGVYSTFPDGMPTQIDITLSFMELAILTKENIVDKF